MTCTPQNGTATATPSSGVPPYTYEWSLGGMVISTDQTIEMLKAGTYTCVITDSVGCQAIVEYIVTARYLGAAALEYDGVNIIVSGFESNRIYRYKDNDPLNFDYIFDETDNNFDNDYITPNGVAFVPDIDGLGNSGYAVVSGAESKLILYDANWKLIGLRTYSNAGSYNKIKVDATRNQYLLISTADDSAAVADVVQAYNDSIVTIEDTISIPMNALIGIDFNPLNDKFYISGGTTASFKRIYSIDVAEGSLSNVQLVVSESTLDLTFAEMTLSDANDAIWVIDRQDQIVDKYNLSGTYISSKTIPSPVDPIGITTDGTFLYVSDSGSILVNKISI